MKHSRNERNVKKLFRCAEMGQYNSALELTKRETISLQKKGLTVTRFTAATQKSPCIIDWSNPFPVAMPIEVLSYINHKSDKYPKELNLAQQLYAIAARYNNDY